MASVFRLRVLLPAGAVLAIVGLGAFGFLFLRGLWRATLAANRSPAVQVRLVAAFPGASAEEVENLVTIPLEVTLAGMPGLRHTCSRSFPEFSEVCVRFADGTSYDNARQEVINCLALPQNLPPGVSPQLDAVFPDTELLRYTLEGPRDAKGRPVFSPRDLRAVQDWTLERTFRRIPGVHDACSHGGAVKCYEVQPDPERMKKYGVTLAQLLDTLARENGHVGGGDVLQGKAGLVVNVRALGMLGGGLDPMEKALTMKTAAAAAYLRDQEKHRLRELRQVVLRPHDQRHVLVDDVVEGGPILGKPAGLGANLGRQGVIVGHLARTSLIVRSRPPAPGGAAWRDDEVVGGVVYRRPGEDPQQALEGVRARLKVLSDRPGDLLPGLRVDVYAEHADDADAGPLWLLADLPADLSVEGAAARVAKARARLQKFTEVGGLVTEINWPDSGAPTAAFSQARLCVLLRPQAEWPPAGDGPRTRADLAAAMAAETSRGPAALDWRTADGSPADWPEAFVPDPAEGLVKLFGPDLETLAQVGQRVEAKLKAVPAVAGVRVLSGKGRRTLSLHVNRHKCAHWGVTMTDVNNVLAAALGGRVATQMIEGEKTFDVVLRWPERLRRAQADLLKLPVAAAPFLPADGPPGPGIPPTVPLGKLVTPEAGKGERVRVGPAVIHREDGKRLLPIRFRVRPGRQTADVAGEARQTIQQLLPAGYRAEWAP
jgi:Cu/Ag efflux pump CusA